MAAIPKLVLIDDDGLFCQLMTHAAPGLGATVTAYQSLADMKSFAFLKAYDLALLDFHLKSWNGVEIAQYIDAFFPELPVIIISANTVEIKPSWPTCIKGFLAKQLGHENLLHETLRLYDRHTRLKNLEHREFPPEGAVQDQGSSLE